MPIDVTLITEMIGKYGVGMEPRETGVITGNGIIVFSAWAACSTKTPSDFTARFLINYIVLKSWLVVVPSALEPWNLKNVQFEKSFEEMKILIKTKLFYKFKELNCAPLD